MLVHLIALGVIASSGGALEPGSGTVDVPAAQTAVLKAGTATAGSTTGIPPTATLFVRPFDPSDHAPYAFDFSELLDDGESIATIERFQVSAAAALLGVGVDDDPDFLPIIDTEGEKVGFWPKVDPSFEFNAAFTSPGIKAGIAIKIKTDAAQPKTFERTGQLSVVQQ